ncbi:ADP-heptose--LPS heptosyltransferase [Ramlibacter rhizophilus]|uniref:ADP-heptose--LPS heptosyltransferase n=1 Tax=Ramlibacter rhizophilus TaxID=1781167 RepID=A0A4Z0BYL5_9BURK|nr:ADP-heptose--LPS heptosyltransferase [Ramlibacter rhizophilus]TFZ04343.1 ADP-heptose--LPS heptosyltransferase [Ramlibacter rhizophilus]
MTETELQDVATRWQAAMRAGDFEAAWRQTDRIEGPRREQQHAPGFVRGPQHLVWDGTPPAGRSVLVRCLHGLGDTLQFMRFVPTVAAQARELHFLVQPMLLALLQGAPGLGKVSNAWTDHPPAHEVEIEVMELPYALRSTAATLPPPYPHLPPRVRERQVFVLPVEAGQRRVALFWSASRWDPSRSLPFDALAPLLALPGFRFYDLQQDLHRNADVLAAPLVPVWRHTESILAAASALLEMDLVIAVDGMPAHLAATLGRPTWLLLKHEADWRWGEGRSDSPWYPGLRIFRQPRPGDWEGLVDEVMDAATRLPPLH